ncbi:hypothetical protein PPYR_02313 [Photinus pyralis]|uniref:Transposase domain-containing protein n=1 Tax=Photinus pyralis TaxID=7054 RepID=A0A1Y1L8P9_PHOPY|nr:hypothetical protein PPYR_02313 [Photinus pyralis]
MYKPTSRSAKHISIKRKLASLKHVRYATDQKKNMETYACTSTSSTTVLKSNGDAKQTNINNKHMFGTNIPNSFDSHDESVHEIEHLQLNISSNSSSNSNSVCDIDNQNLPSDCNTHMVPSITTLPEELKFWSITEKVTHKQLNSLLRILKKYHSGLPLCSKTLLNTSDNYEVKNMASLRNTTGEFVYFGVHNFLTNFLDKFHQIYLQHDEKIVYLLINIDGIPIQKSTSNQLWPILASVISPDFKSTPWPIAIFYGDSKPFSIGEFLAQFIIEMKHLTIHGLLHNNTQYSIKIKSFICDAPARAFIKCIKSHNSYYGCERCTIRGVYLDNKVVFPDLNCDLRTHISFINRHNKEHHVSTSPLVQLDIDLINDVTLDYMHMACLGVMKRLLNLWIKIRSANSLSRCKIILISNLLHSVRNYIPVEFQRKPRTLNELDRWKATEFRFFMLYIGPIVLNNFLPKKLYKNFLYYHCAIRIICSKKLLEEYGCVAIDCIKFFFCGVKKIYGEQETSYNMHSIYHLVHDAVTANIPVDQISCFVFESFLGKLKHLIRTPNKPLSQICRRLSENFPTISLYRQSNNIINIKKNKLGFINFIEYDNFCIKADTSADSYIWLKNNKVMHVAKIEEIGTELFFFGHVFQSYSNLYSIYSITSSKLYTSVVSDKSSFLFKINAKDFFSKCVVFIVENNMVAVAMLHHTN